MANSPIGAKYRRFEFWPYIWLAVIVAIVTLLRIRFLNIPLMRDEGAFAYMGRLIMEGIAPYTQAYDARPPGLYLVFAGFESALGDTARGIHIGLMLENLATVAAVFFLARKWMNYTAALWAAAVYGVLSLSSSVMGFAAHASHFVAFWSVMGALFLAWWSDRGGRVLLVLAGCSMGLAFFMRQPALVFLLYGIIMVLIRRRDGGFNFRARFLDEVWFLGGAVIPLLIATVWLLAAGAFQRYIFWTFGYGVDFGSQVGLEDVILRFLQSFPSAMGEFWIVWVLAGIGLVMYLTSEEGESSQLQFILFALAALISVSLGFQFRMEYFVEFLPLIAMLAGYFVFGLREVIIGRNSRSHLAIAPLVVLFIALGFGMVAERQYFFTGDNDVVMRKLYSSNPFADAGRIGGYLRGQTLPQDRIAILGSEPEILYTAGTKSASPYLFMYPFMESHDTSLAMEKDMAAGIEHAAPKYIVYVKQMLSWGVRPNSESYIYNWAGDYLKRGYDLEGIADMSSPSETHFRWGAEAATKSSGSEDAVLIFRRK